MNWYVYITKAITGRYYTGITSNPELRLIRHNSKRGSRFAINQGPFKIMYISLPFGSKSDARKREVQIKGWTREKKENLIKKIWR